MKAKFRGSLVALPTPFRDGELDLASLGGLIDGHVRMGSDGLVVAGTTGEAATLTDYERRTVVEFAVERCAGRLPVLAGTGTNSTRTSIEHTRWAAEAGADGALVVTPYYNRPTPSGLIAHFGAVAEASEIPIVLYNVPSRTGCDLKPDTAAEIRRRNENVVAIKEASGSVGRARELLHKTDLVVLSGEDALIAELMAAGAAGVIGVVANVAPAEVAELCRTAVPGGDPARTAELAAWLDPLVRALFVETNPVPVKAALAELGRCPPEVRLPLVPLERSSREVVRAALAECGLLRAAPAAVGLE
jgi:4-hydroxy-tetrahydrodipicolinate synthase